MPSGASPILLYSRTARADVQPMHVDAYIEQLQGQRSAPTAKQHLACIRMLFDWLVTGQVVPTNPAHSVRGLRHSVSRESTPVLASEEASMLLGGMDVSSVVGPAGSCAHSGDDLHLRPR